MEVVKYVIMAKVYNLLSALRRGPRSPALNYIGTVGVKLVFVGDYINYI